MAANPLHSRRPPMLWALVLGLTSGSVSAAAPPEPVPIEIPAPPESAPAVELRSTATAIEVTAVPLGADGEPSGPAVELGAPPISTHLAAGRWRLEARGRGYESHTREIEVTAGHELAVQLEPELIDGARVELRIGNPGSEGATVTLDGAELCRIPCSETIEPGLHTLEITKRRHKPLRSRFDATQADEVTFDVSLERSTSRAPALVVGVVGLASLTTAFTFTGLSAHAYRSLTADLDVGVQVDQDDPRIASGRNDAIVAAAMYGVSAAVGALTLYYLLRQSGPSSRADKRRRSLATRGPSPWRLSPGFGPQGGTLTLTVGF